MAQTIEQSQTAKTNTDYKPTSRLVCPNCKSKNIIKSGIRRAKKKTIQRYLCKNCHRIFSLELLKRTSYPPNVILNAISLYNFGHTLKQTRSLIRRQFKMDPKEPTIHTWLANHKDICTFIPLRKRYSLDPQTTIKSKKLYHTQIYHFKSSLARILMKADIFSSHRLFSDNN